jgi:hypothetical protein
MRSRSWKLGTIALLIALVGIVSANTQWQVTDTVHDLLVGSNLVVNATSSTAGLTDSNQAFLTGIASDSSTGTQNNFAPTGLGSASVLVESPASALTINGLASPVSGQFLIVINAGVGTVTIGNEAAGSTAANRIWAQNDSNLTLAGNSTDPNTGALLWYSASASRWLVIAANQVNWNSVMTMAGGVNITGGSLLISGTSSHVLAIGGTAPTLSSCGTGTPSITGTDVAGKFTTGTVGTSCTLTFGSTYTNPPSCFVQPEGTATQPTWSNNATAITITVDIAATTYDYGCISIGAGGT